MASSKLTLGIDTEAVKSWLEKADMVPVVRCKDCKHYEIDRLKKDGTDDRRYKPTFCTFLRLHLPEDWYCADGERRKDERGNHAAHDEDV